MSKQILNIPAGYEASFTTDALTTGSYLQYDEAHTGYSAVSLAASTSYTIGPFNTVTNFQFNTVGNTQINFDIEFSGYYTAADEASAGGTPAESDVTFTDIDTNNASTDMHGYLPKLSGDDTEYLNGDGGWSQPPSGGTVNDTDIVFTDNTTNDVSTDEHGYAPKLSGDATEYLDGTGAYSVPAGGGGGGGMIVCSTYVGTSVTSAVPDASFVVIPYNTVLQDDDSLFAISGSPSYRFTASTAGLYLINASCSLHTVSPTGVDQFSAIILHLGGSEIATHTEILPEFSGNGDFSLAITRTVKLAVNDYIEVLVYQTSGQSIDITAQHIYSTTFSAVQVA